MSDTPIRREAPPKLDRDPAAHERRARLIAQLHEQAIATATDLFRFAGVAHSAHGTERGYSLKILCFRSHVSDREFIQFTAEAWSLKVLTGSRVPSGHSASTSH